MISTRKGQESGGLALVGKAVIIIIIVLVLLSIIGKFFPGILKLQDCTDRGGFCAEKSGGCGDKAYELISVKGCSEGNICCKSTEPGIVKLEQFTPAERSALENAIILTLNNDPTPIGDRARLDLKVDTEYEFKIRLNDKLTKSGKTKEKLGKCIVYVKDEREEGKIYSLTSTSTELVPVDSITDIDMFNCDEHKKIEKKKYKPGLLDVYKDLVMYVILLDNESKPKIGILSENDKENLFSNVNHWLAFRAYRLNVEPIVSISGLSGAWVNKDEITISCSDVTCTKFGIKLVKLNENQDYEDMIRECSNGNDFAYTIDNIAGTTVKTTGIPLNIDIGGFRLPSQQKVQYITTQQPIIISENKATLTIDKATMINNLHRGKNELLVEASTYLCAQATIKDGRTERNVYGLSKTPIRIDVLPPYVEQETGIEVFYPEIIEEEILNQMGQRLPYYYRQYPRVVISSCYDYGQSGCAHYDYYVHTGNFVQLSSVSADWETGIKALLLTQGLNMLFNQLASADPLNTICPYMFGYGYRSNTNPEIRFRREGQSIMCLKIGDKVGNAELYWKQIWTPSQMFKKIFAQGAANITGLI